MNTKVDAFITKAKKWQNEYEVLREIVLDCGLYEDFKWGVPCYTLNNKNVILIHGFKDYCAILFHKGVFLKDTEHLLIQQTENVKSARQIRFSNTDEIHKIKSIIKTYIFEAIEIEKAGLKVDDTLKKDIEIPQEFEEHIKINDDFKQAFYALTPGRQTGYLYHFSQAKQSKTRTARITKCMPRILDGKGLNDCTCGLSKKMPNCDGSHKILAIKK